MTTVQERPTRVQPTAPRTGSAGSAGVQPRDPGSLAPGGPGQPPRPPKRTGGGGGGGGDGQGVPPDGPGDPGRRGLYTVIALATILVVIVVAIGTSVLGSGSNEGGVTGDAVQTTGDPSAPSAQATAEATNDAATPEATPAADDSASATTSQDETGGVAVGGGGQTGDGADASDAEAEANAPLLTAGKVTKIEAKQGGTVRFRVTSDTAQEVHVHGYDRKYDLAAGETKTIAFPASLTGIFEVEFEGTSTQIGELRVDP